MTIFDEMKDWGLFLAVLAVGLLLLYLLFRVLVPSGVNFFGG